MIEKKTLFNLDAKQRDSCEITQVQRSGPTVRATASRRVWGSAARISEELYRSLRRPEAGSQSRTAPTAEAESVSCLSSSGSAGTGTAVRRRPRRWLPQVSWCHSPEEQASLNVNNMPLKKTFGIQFGCEVLPYKRFWFLFCSIWKFNQTLQHINTWKYFGILSLLQIYHFKVN